GIAPAPKKKFFRRCPSGPPRQCVDGVFTQAPENSIGQADRMRTLVLLRHAKAETPGDKPDFERELAHRGRRDATAAGSWLAVQGLYPDLVICSPATRTRQTWHQVAVALAQAVPEHAAPQVHYDPGLYEGGRTEVIDAPRRVPADVVPAL